MYRPKEKKTSLSGATLSYLLLAVICVASFVQDSFAIDGKSSADSINLALKNRHLFRFKRQQPNLGAPQASVNPKQQQGSSSAPVPTESATNPQDTSAQDEKPPDEALSSLKCDFGTSDSPDLCKFTIVESANPSSKGLATWSHGSGKLALFHGGPLIDASDRNDTSGGYIFYETSNQNVPANSNQTGVSSNQGPTMFGSGHHLYGTIRGITNQPLMGNNHESMHNDYSTISTQAFIKSPLSHRTNEPQQQHGQSDQFQHVTSSRLAVGGAGNQMASAGPAFISPNLTAPGSSGMCLSFQYAIRGLSADELRIHVNDHKSERSRQIWASSESSGGNWTRGEVLYSVTNMHSIMFSAAPSPSSLAKDFQQRKFRGYIALDELEINKHDPSGSETSCKGHCNFDGDLCGWTNAENGQEDDFDWSFGRGSDNIFTGPPRDYTSSTNNEVTGSYLHTDSGYPRRPGDRAILMSPMFQPTAVNDAMCMRLAVHMFGSGIGSLVIKIRYADDVGEPVAAQPGSGTPVQGGANNQAPSGRSSSEGKTNNDLVIWEMSGDAGNSWHQAQTSVSSSKSPFQVLIEGVIGENHLGDVAIDEISFSSGPCPTSPPVASKNYGDCTFEQSMCYWKNPDADMHLDDLDWIRSADEQSIHGPNFDHTLKKKSGSYLKLENTFREPKSGTRAFLLSPIFPPKAQGTVQCLSFYYYMFMRSISSSGPNLGTIRLYLATNNDLIPIWRLTNPISSPSWKHGRASLSAALIDGQPTAPTKLFQIAFEGIWGDATGGAIAIDDITVFDGACDIMPAEAKSVPGECTFDVDMCSWSNKTSEMSPGPDSADSSRGPFLQSVNSASGGAAFSQGRQTAVSKKSGWLLATVDSRPVNLQDHTYKAPIGYAYVDILDSTAQRMSFPLQSSEVTVQSGQQIVQCLSFWFAAYGRQENNQLSVYITQASAPPPAPEDDTSGPISPALTSSTRQSTSSTAAGATGGQAGQQASASTATNSPLPSIASNAASPSDSDNAWKSFDGKLLWTLSLKNITEMNRRKWQYGQATLKADSNHIVRFIALSNDGGFALDDISYYEGACETRPASAKVQSEDDTTDTGPSGPPKP